MNAILQCLLNIDLFSNELTNTYGKKETSSSSLKQLQLNEQKEIILDDQEEKSLYK